MDNRYDINRIEELAYKLNQGTLTETEQAEFNEWYNSFSDQELKLPEGSTLNPLAIRDRMHDALLLKIKTDSSRSVRLWPRIAVAAAAVAAIVFGVWLYSNKYQDASIKTGSTASVKDIAPGKNGATIMLANGKVIELSDEKTGVVIGKDLKYNDGTDLSGSRNEFGTGSRTREATMLTASTARSQTYQFTLPDGTKVWLNADSKISFPRQFSGQERKILLDGEGYFEVAKDKAHPFIVETNRQKIEVLGTHFNVSAYANDVAVKTTLLEGRVAVSGDGGKVTLDPGDQAYSGSDGLRAKTLSNPEAELDWKNGDFVFEQESLADIMRKVSRWYDVDVVFDAAVDKGQTFGGKVSRKRNISQVIKALQATQALKFKIEGKKVYVSN